MILHLRDLDADASGGVLYVTIRETSFPEEGWYDLVAVDFENWLPSLLSFARGHTDRCTLQFMDAPAVVRLTRQNGSVSAVCLWNHKPVLPETEIDFRTFLESTARCVRQYNRILHEQGKPIRFEPELTAIKTILNHP